MFIFTNTSSEFYRTEFVQALHTRISRKAYEFKKHFSVNINNNVRSCNSDKSRMKTVSKYML